MLNRTSKDHIENLVFFLHRNARKKPFNPVFIIGCGRSGTSILGTTLFQHPDIHYLEEPFFIYNRIFPEMEIYFKPNDESIIPKLFYNSIDFEEVKANNLKYAFHRKLVFKNKKVLVEKMPLNVFRLEWLYKIFPTARFIYIHRNGLEVAASMLRRGPSWFGRKGLKWELLKTYALENEKIKNIVPEVKSNFEKGLLEWRISMELTTRFFNRLDDQKYHTITYQQFMDHPVEEINRILEFMDLPKNKKLDNYILKTIKRRSDSLTLNDFEEKEKLQLIGGPFL